MKILYVTKGKHLLAWKYQVCQEYLMNCFDLTTKLYKYSPYEMRGWRHAS